MPEPESIGEFLRAVVDDAALRPWSTADAPALVAAWADPEVARWNGVPPNPSLDVAQRWLAGASRQTTASGSIDIVSVDSDGNLQGEVGFVIDHDRRMAEVGFWVGEAHRRSGVATRLLRAAAALAPALGIERAFAITSVDNRAAVALLEANRWPEVATTTDDRRAFLAPTAPTNR